MSKSRRYHHLPGTFHLFSEDPFVARRRLAFDTGPCSLRRRLDSYARAGTRRARSIIKFLLVTVNLLVKRQLYRREAAPAGGRLAASVAGGSGRRGTEEEGKEINGQTSSRAQNCILNRGLGNKDASHGNDNRIQHVHPVRSRLSCDWYKQDPGRGPHLLSRPNGVHKALHEMS